MSNPIPPVFDVVTSASLGILNYQFNDNRVRWSKEREFLVKNKAGGPCILRAKALGSYRTRQWDFVYSDAAEVSIALIEEEVEVEGADTKES